MPNFKDKMPEWSPRTKLGAGAAVLLALGAAGGAGAMSMTRPAVEMAPSVQTAIARLPATTGVVTVKGRVAEVYGDRFVIQDQTGRTMVDAGRDASASVGSGQPVLVQGRFDGGQLRASYLVGSDGQVNAVGPAGRPHGPDGRGRRGHDGPPVPGGDVRVGGASGPPPPPSGSPGTPPPPGRPGCDANVGSTGRPAASLPIQPTSPAPAIATPR